VAAAVAVRQASPNDANRQENVLTVTNCTKTFTLKSLHKKLLRPIAIQTAKLCIIKKNSKSKTSRTEKIRLLKFEQSIKYGAVFLASKWQTCDPLYVRLRFQHVFQCAFFASSSWAQAFYTLVSTKGLSQFVKKKDYCYRDSVNSNFVKCRLPVSVSTLTSTYHSRSCIHRRGGSRRCTA
jgi:hypothetical protein